MWWNRPTPCWMPFVCEIHGARISARMLQRMWSLVPRRTFNHVCCCRRSKRPDTAHSNASSANEDEGQEGDDILFDINSAVGSGRWPCVDGAANTPNIHAGGRMRSKSPAPSVLSLGGSTRAESTRGRGKNRISSPISDDGVSIMSGSTWGGRKGVTSPGRCE